MELFICIVDMNDECYRPSVTVLRERGSAVVNDECCRPSVTVLREREVQLCWFGRFSSAERSVSEPGCELCRGQRSL